MTATVKYELAHLKGEMQVPFVDPEDDNEVIIDKAKSELRKKLQELDLLLPKYLRLTKAKKESKDRKPHENIARFIDLG